MLDQNIRRDCYEMVKIVANSDQILEATCLQNGLDDRKKKPWFSSKRNGFHDTTGVLAVTHCFALEPDDKLVGEFLVDQEVCKYINPLLQMALVSNLHQIAVSFQLASCSEANKWKTEGPHMCSGIQ